MKNAIKTNAKVTAALHGRNAVEERPRIVGEYRFTCRDKHGRVKWEEEIRNLVPNAALDHILDVVLAAGTQITSWFVGLKGAGSPAAGDTHASHAGWTEVTDYDEATRPAWTAGAVSGQSVDNSASPAGFTFNASVTVNGGFVANVDTKGSTAAGVLFSVGDFPAPRAVVDDDTLDVTVSYTQAAA